MLDKNDVDQMVRDAQEHAEEDRQRREEVETRNQAEALTFQAERTIKDLGDKVSSEDKAEVENKVASLREALKGSDIEAVKTGIRQARAAPERGRPGVRRGPQPVGHEHAAGPRPGAHVRAPRWLPARPAARRRFPTRCRTGTSGRTGRPDGIG